MKIIKLTIILTLTVAVLSFIKEGHSFHITHVIPFCDGEPANNRYQFAGLAICIITVWGYYRLMKSKDDE